MLPVIILVWLQDLKSPFYIADRVGKNRKIFKMVKLRSMVIGADKSGVDSTGANDSRITTIGKLIRKFKLDEISQLWNVLLGDMSLVGPRPCLSNQIELIKKRELSYIFSVKPGITGLAQIKGIDMSDPEKLVEIEKLMISNFHHRNYFKYLFLTFYGKGFGDRISF